jgi:hypothetical protein
MVDYYEILQVSRKADHDVINAAYRRLSFKHHPDRNPGNAAAEKMMKGLNEAWEILGDASSRSKYDGEREVADRQAEQEAARQAEQSRTEAQERAAASERAAQARAAVAEKPEPATKKPTVRPEPSRPVNKPPVLQPWPPGWVVSGANVLFVISFLIVALALSDTDKPGYELYRRIADPSWVAVVLIGAGIAASGFGVRAGKLWAVIISLKMYNLATICAGGLLFLNMGGSGDRETHAILLLIFLLPADLFFALAKWELNKRNRPSGECNAHRVA